MRSHQRTLISLISIVAVLVLWQYLSSNELVNALVLPPPIKIINTLISLIQNGRMFSDIWISTARIIMGFGIAFVLALPLGLIAGSNNFVRYLLGPWIQFIQPIPSIAWVPFAFILFGLSNNAAVFVIALAVFFPIFINVMNGVQARDQHLVNVAKVLGANRLAVLTKVTLPSILPDIISGSRIGISFAWRTVVAAEMIGLRGGVGSLLIEAKNTAQTDVVLVSMVTLGLLMIIFDRIIFVRLEKIVETWRGRHNIEG